ncbi:MAG: bifunctional riboflavin kinase/FAD synthetase [Verrucomicrobiae bacterium]|nr:bifunctional riboflavin kinase/FAD synthetase [Verrucomicrobiae bacterium]
MQTLRHMEELRTLQRPVCFAIGVFDGVHLGHQAVIRRAVEEARQHGGTSVVLTFDPHPMRVTRPQESPLLLTSTEHKLRLIRVLGSEHLLLVHFDQEFSRTSPEDFIRMLHAHCVKLQEICVGYRWAFGRNRAGNIELIARMGSQLGFAVKGMEPVAVDGEIVSSTLVRKLVREGELSAAARLLGRPYSILGEVVPGRRLARQLGFPTANLSTHAELFPPDGVYVVEVLLGGKIRRAVANIGVRPTVETEPRDRLLEVHVLDFEGDLYGQTLEVVFCAALRPEKKFDTLERLQVQVGLDVVRARDWRGDCAEVGVAKTGKTR